MLRTRRCSFPDVEGSTPEHQAQPEDSEAEDSHNGGFLPPVGLGAPVGEAAQEWQEPHYQAGGYNARYRHQRHWGTQDL